MLVLSRRKNQKVYIGDDVVVTVVEVRGNTVKLSFDAPAEISIQREEVRQRLDCERRPALNPQTEPAFSASTWTGC